MIVNQAVWVDLLSLSDSLGLAPTSVVECESNCDREKCLHKQYDIVLKGAAVGRQTASSFVACFGLPSPFAPTEFRLLTTEMVPWP